MQYDFEENEQGNVADVEEYKGWGYRHHLSIILFFYFAIAYCVRSCMGVAIIAMTEDPRIIETENSIAINNTKIVVNSIQKTMLNVTEEENETHGILNLMMLTPPYPKFKWDKKLQDMILSSFFWGYIVLQIPGGQLTHRFGARCLLSAAMMISCIVSLILPWIVFYGGAISVAVCRAILGMAQGCVIPGMHTIIGQWARLEERGKLTAFAYGGAPMGIAIGLPIAGFIASSTFGWPGVFRFYGLLAGIISTIMWFTVTDTPAQHPRISTAEKRYIEVGLGYKDGQRPLKVPWMSILFSRGMVAIAAGHIGLTLSQVFLYSEVPSYLAYVMEMKIKANGVLTALPFVLMWLTNFFFAWLTDMLIKKKILSVTNSRKLANTIGSIPPAICLIFLGYTKNIYVAETLLIFICAIKVSLHFGCYVNHIDISPEFAGIMISITNLLANICASLAPTLTGYIVTDATNQYQWRQVFFVIAGVLFLSNLIYVALGTADRANWDKPKEIEPMLKDVRN